MNMPTVTTIVTNHFSCLRLPRQANGIQHTLISDREDPNGEDWARIVDRSQGDGRVYILLERASGNHPKGTLKNYAGETIYKSDADTALRMLENLREAGAL